MDAEKSILAVICLLCISYRAEAIPITVHASGTIYDGYDYVNILGLGIGSLEGRSVTATWAYDSDNLPEDYYGGFYPDLRWFNEPGVFSQWIVASVVIEGGSDMLQELAYPGGHDYLEVSDGDIPYFNGIPSGRDSYSINSNSTTTQPPPWKGDWFESSAYFLEYDDDLIQGLSGAQIFEWTDNDATDYGNGDFSLRLSDGGTAVYGRYNLNSMTAAVSVPEPTALSLLGIGLAAMGISRRRRV